jgi:hypothetical protein
MNSDGSVNLFLIPGGPANFRPTLAGEWWHAISADKATLA